MALPVSQPHARKAGPRRASRAGRWRTLCLILVYVLFIAHFIHWQIAGETLTPVEPSEAMQTLELGLLNAGFILFALALLSTFIFGRWFCGWTCHIIALQDLCTWSLKKLRLRPQPLRSRALVFVPLAAALYMFVWPSVYRALADQPTPALVNHFLTEDYWDTFPNITMSVVTFLVCGFVIVYLLGNKGYCTYACPYGGFFALADQAAPGKIRVTDACNQCGHCTAACTSNVRVHEEVRVHGMVVDPGCMKCTDCISVCPNDALYFGFGRPSIARGAGRAEPRGRRAAYRWWEELLLVVAFLFALYATRGLYNAIPLLLALGLAAIIAYVIIVAVRMIYTDNLRLQRLQVRLHGKTTRTGWGFAVGCTLLFALLVHSAFVQYHDREAERLVSRLRTQQTDSPEQVAATLAAAKSHFTWLDRWSLIATPKVPAQLGALHLFDGQLDDAERYLSRALALEPNYGAARHKWAELIARRGELAPALEELQTALQLDPSLSEARVQLVQALQARGALDTALATLEMIVRRRPHDLPARRQFARLLAQAGQLEAAEAQFREALRQGRDWPADVFEHGLVLLRLDRTDDGLAALRRAVRLEPDNVRSHLVAAQAGLAVGRPEFAREMLAPVPTSAALESATLETWAALRARAGEPKSALTQLERDDATANEWYAAALLRAALGDVAGAQRALTQAQERNPALPKPNFISP